MIGVLSWVVAGAAASLLARLVPRRRMGLWVELFAGVAVAVLAGLAATWLDFGGIATLDWRSAAFALLAAAAAVAAARLAG